MWPQVGLMPQPESLALAPGHPPVTKVPVPRSRFPVPYLAVMPIVHPTSFVHSSATVCGNVTLGPRVSVWASAVIRGDSDAIEIGEDSNIQDGTVVHADEGVPTKIGKRVGVGHR